MKYTLLALLLTAAAAGGALANNVQITNVTVDDASLQPSLNGLGDLRGYLLNVDYDLSWDNSWRIDVGPSNWDGVYVFARYREDGGEWKPFGNTLGSDQANFNSAGFSENGSIIYRDSPGTGDVSLTEVTYRGLIDDPDFDPNAEIEVRFFAVEMVWIPEGEFDLGQSAGKVMNQFFGRTILGTNTTYPISGEGLISVDQFNLNGRFFKVSRDDENAGETTGIIPSIYPKGFAGFWMMKYEVSQQQYADFFNTLTPTQQTLLDPTGPNGKNTDAVLNRNGCSVTAGEMTTTLPNLPMTYVNAAMALAYLDWARLRPMTELEFEKACRGTRAAVDDEYAWGTDKVATALYGLTDAGLPVERVTNLSTTAGNAFYRGTAVFTGMTRVGAIAGSVASPAREQSGASYYGVMDLSGNASEFAITAGSEEGREFEDARGDYQLGP